MKRKNLLIDPDQHQALKQFAASIKDAKLWQITDEVLALGIAAYKQKSENN